MTGNASDTGEFLSTLLRHNRSLNQAFANIKLGKKQTDVRIKIDTGLQVNILPLSTSTFNKLGLRQPLRKCSQSLPAYNGDKLDVQDMFTLQSTDTDITIDQELFVVKTYS